MKSSQTFTSTPSDSEYLIQLKKKKFPWWIFLFLLFLLLLIKCEKDIDFKVIDAETLKPIVNAQVSIHYQPEGKTEQIANKTTDEEGLANFVIDKQPFYQLLFDKSLNSIIVNVEALHPDYSTEYFTDKLGSLWGGEQLIKLKKGGRKVVIKTIDSISRKPIQLVDAEVVVENDTINSQSNQQGIAVAEKVKLKNNSELIVTCRKSDYETTRKNIIIANVTAIDTIIIPMLSIENGGLRGERGEFNVNLKWASKDDLDLILIAPCNDTIYFKKRKVPCKGFEGILDIDANVGPDSLLSDPQENIYWNTAPKGEYQIIVLYYKKRTFGKVPFKVTLLLNNKKQEFNDVLKTEREYKFLHSFTY